MRALVATPATIVVVDPRSGTVEPAEGLAARPTCVRRDAIRAAVAWCGTRRDGVWRSEDGGATWRAAGLDGAHVTAIASDPNEPGVVWAGTEPSAIWRRAPAGLWRRMDGLLDLPSSGEWSFPPRPETHHVRWIECDPSRPGRLWAAIEAGALVSTTDAGESWQDRVPGGPYDTHELAIHPARPGMLRVAGGDGWFESHDGGATWASPADGLDVSYLRSVAVDPGDPDVVVVSGASHAHATYMAGRSDGRLYRRAGAGPWRRVREGWPDPPSTIAPLLAAGAGPGEVWAADERGLHRSDDGGASWAQVASFDPSPDHLRGLAAGLSNG